MNDYLSNRQVSANKCSEVLHVIIAVYNQSEVLCSAEWLTAIKTVLCAAKWCNKCSIGSASSKWNLFLHSKNLLPSRGSPEALSDFTLLSALSKSAPLTGFAGGSVQIYFALYHTRDSAIQRSITW